MYTKYTKYKLDLFQNDRLEDDCSNPKKKKTFFDNL